MLENPYTPNHHSRKRGTQGALIPSLPVNFQHTSFTDNVAPLIAESKTGGFCFDKLSSIMVLTGKTVVTKSEKSSLQSLGGAQQLVTKPRPLFSLYPSSPPVSNSDSSYKKSITMGPATYRFPVPGIMSFPGKTPQDEKGVAQGQGANERHSSSQPSDKTDGTGSDFNAGDRDESDEEDKGDEPPPSQKPESAHPIDTKQHSVDQLVVFSAAGDVGSVTGMINTFGQSLLFGLHSQSGDSALHAAVRNHQATTIHAIDELGSDKKERLWQLKNRSGETPKQLQETGSLPCDRTEDIIHTNADINKKSSEDELLAAAASGNSERVQALLTQGVSPSVMNDHKRTPLHLAAQYGHAELVRMFLKLSLTEYPPYTPMHSAASGGFIDIMDLLIAHYKNVNARSANQLTAMHMASTGGHVSAMEWLFAKGAEILPRDKEDGTPMHYAAAGGYVSAMEWLFSKGAEVSPRDKEGQTPMHYAAAGGHVSAMEWLFGKGAEILPRDKGDGTPMHNAADGGHVSAMEWLFSKGSEVSPCDKHGRTPMYGAAAEGHMPAMEWLLAKGVDVDIDVAAKSWSPISRACFSGHVEAAKWLLAHGADITRGRPPFHAAARGGHINLMIWLKDDPHNRIQSVNGWTAMHSAALGNQVPAMEWLLTQGESVNAKDGNGGTPIYAAAMVGSLDAMKWLAERGADVMVCNKAGRTLMHAAAASGDLPTMEWLLSKGAYIDALTQYNETPLYTAVTGEMHLQTKDLKKKGNLDAMKWLLDHGANINKGRHPYFAAIRDRHSEIIRWLETNNHSIGNDQGGWTPMHSAALGGDIGVMEHLLERGHDVNAINSRDFTPMCEAAKQGNIAAVEWLYNHGAVYRRGMPHPFLLAAQYGHIEVMNWLEKYHLRFRCTNSGRTPMHAAALNGQISAMERLLELGDNVNAVTRSLHTPLYEAAKGGNLEAIKWLLNHGADIRIGVSPHKAAKRNRYKEVYDWLLDYRADR